MADLKRFLVGNKCDNRLVVLAGGLGTRLRSAVPELPKPLAPIVGRPFLEYLIENWVRQGIQDLILVLHHKADLIEKFLVSVKQKPWMSNCEIQTVTEPQPMGTGGAVAYAVRKLGLADSFMVANADTWLEDSIVMVSHERPPAMAVVQVENADRYGSVRCKQSLVAAFEEKRNSLGPGWINAGLYHLTAESFRTWDGVPFSLERDLFPRLVAEQILRAVSLNTNFIDIGIPEDYFRFCRWIESGRKILL